MKTIICLLVSQNFNNSASLLTVFIGAQSDVKLKFM